MVAPIVAALPGLAGPLVSGVEELLGLGKRKTEYKPYDVNEQSVYGQGYGGGPAGGGSYAAEQSRLRGQKIADLQARGQDLSGGAKQKIDEHKFRIGEWQRQLESLGGHKQWVLNKDAIVSKIGPPPEPLWQFVSKVAGDIGQVDQKINAIQNPSPEQQQKDWVQGVQRFAEEEKAKFSEMAKAGLISGQQAIEGMRAADAKILETRSIIEDAVAGRAPSVAQMQQTQGLEDAAAQAMGQAASTRGLANQGIAARAAVQTAADLGQRTVRENALLRAKEIEAARGQLTGNDAQLVDSRGRITGATNDLYRTTANIYGMGTSAVQNAQGVGTQIGEGAANRSTTLEGVKAGAYADAQRLNFGGEAANAARETNLYNSAIGGITGGANAYIAREDKNKQIEEQRRKGYV